MSMQTSSQKIPGFDPFRNRLCRDVRNDLSESFILAIRRGDLEEVRSVAEKYRAETSEQFVTSFIADRMERYERVLAQMRGADVRTDEVYVVALFMWDQALFFEFHEWLEKAWHASKGDEKKILQALIRAAGTYILLAYNRPEGAKKMATKASGLLTRDIKMIPDIFDIELLIRKLKALDPVAPELGAARLVAKRARGNNSL